MKEIMNWQKCLEEHITRVDKDSEKIKSIIRMCNIRLKIVKQIKIDQETASVIASDYYEVIKELLTALLLKNELKSDNHECLISFFKQNFPEYEYETKIIHQLKDVRNRVSYDGVFVKKDYIDINKLEFQHIINLLKKLLESFSG
ncbi:MAG: hypothetical protein KJ968_02935 [Nanoarchaeota archaeon]|nr:hypothetical protein [Nanoarchaeota archaeon]